MMRKPWLMALFLLVPLQGQEPDLFYDKMVKFDREWNQFKLEYLGCPRSYTTDSMGRLVNCSGTGSLDYQKLKKAKAAAASLFDLIPAP